MLCRIIFVWTVGFRLLTVVTVVGSGIILVRSIVDCGVTKIVLEWTVVDRGF